MWLSTIHESGQEHKWSFTPSNKLGTTLKTISCIVLSNLQNNQVLLNTFTENLGPFGRHYCLNYGAFRERPLFTWHLAKVEFHGFSNCMLGNSCWVGDILQCIFYKLQKIRQQIRKTILQAYFLPHQARSGWNTTILTCMKTFGYCCCINKISCTKTAYNMWIDFSNFDHFLKWKKSWTLHNSMTNHWNQYNHLRVIQHWLTSMDISTIISCNICL